MDPGLGRIDIEVCVSVCEVVTDVVVVDIVVRSWWSREAWSDGAL